MIDRRRALVTFDLDDTLWETEPVLRRADAAQHRWLAEHCPALATRFGPEDWKALRLDVIERHPHSKTNLSMLRQMTLLEALKRSGYGHDDAVGYSAQAFNIFLEARCDVEFFDGVHETLERLRRRYFLCVITNGNADLRRVGLEDAFDFACSAETVGVAKPDAAIFHRALERFAVPPEAAVHVGDDPVKDVQAALDVGMQALWVNVLGRTLDPQPSVPEIRELRELPGHLEALLPGA